MFVLKAFDEIDGFKKRMTFTGLFLVFSLFYAFLFTLIFPYLPDWMKEDFGKGTVSIEALLKMSFPDLILGLVFSCFAEELIFRFPLIMISTIIRSRTGAVMFFVIMFFGSLVLSCIFGYIHGGLLNTVMQGVLGFAFSLVAIRCGLFYAVLCHFFYNFILVTPMFLFGGAT
jgi:hypothetical protein